MSLCDQDAWRNLVIDWHLQQGMPDCGCDDDTRDTDFCTPSIAYADDCWANRPDPHLAGPEDPWDYSSWIRGWGLNVPLIVEDTTYRLPSLPPRFIWLTKRILVAGRRGIELVLVRFVEDRIVILGRVRSVPEPSSVISRARRLLSRHIPVDEEDK